jgi:hypothetical protein
MWAGKILGMVRAGHDLSTLDWAFLFCFTTRNNVGSNTLGANALSAMPKD